MKNFNYITLSLFVLVAILSCSQRKEVVTATKNKMQQTEQVTVQNKKSHQYGGWFCPDNLNGFPAVDLANWHKVPVINDRLPTQEETRNGTSLIFVDQEKYPDARPMDIKMPKLARFYNEHSRKKELVIVIQAIEVQQDSIIGFRYLNGGNGSARFNEITFVSDYDIKNIKPVKFVNQTINIDASREVIWGILTNPKHYKTLQPIFDQKNNSVSGWEHDSKVNYSYMHTGNITNTFASELYGNYYIQIDSENGKEQYVEKFMLLHNSETKMMELKIVCGPYGDDFETQQTILTQWGQQIKTMSEQQIK